ncbi:DNA primase [Fodinicurvata sp. EGI_FJ10296]|uniref:DNA primase n=1 Tax=Fodinicurvata sp. EGI_FJ10296 TaxID=3231908 RepID=UPI0034570212
MSIPPSFLEDVKSRIGLSDLVGRSVRLKKAGREYSGLCPFHKEKSPSFTVNNDKGFFHCFGCGAHGDHIGFLTDHDGLSFMDAVETLASMAGMEVPRPAPGDQAREKRRKTLHDLVEEACRYFQGALNTRDGETARDYLKGRGLDDAAITRFRIGYAPAAGQRLVEHLTAREFDPAAIEEAGLIRTPEDGRKPYAFFRDRIVFPVTDRRGRVVAFGGRALNDNGPKYLNSPDGPIFHKGRLLYNLAGAAPAVQRGHGLIVVEGYMDVVALVRAGFHGAVAPLGTALTEEQVDVLWQVSRAPVICFDGDNAGLRAAFRAAERVLPRLRPDHTIKIAFLPSGDDPDSLVRRDGTEAVRKVLTAALPLAEIVWREEYARHDVSAPEGLAGLRAGLDQRAQSIGDSTVRTYYQQHFRDRLAEVFPSGNRFAGWGNDNGRSARPGSGSDSRGAWKSGGRGRGGWFGNQGRANGARAAGAGGSHVSRYAPLPVEPPSRVTNARSLMPLILLALIINHPRAFDEYGEVLGLLRIEDAQLDRLRQKVIAVLSAYESETGADLETQPGPVPGAADAQGETVLDSEAAKGHLINSLDTDALKRLDLSGVYDHAPYVGSDRSDEAAIDGWRETWRLHGVREVRDEIRRALSLLEGDPSEGNRQRISALKSIVAENRGTGP